MSKLTEFIIKDIKKQSGNILSLTVRTGRVEQTFSIDYHSSERVNLPHDLEVLMMHKEFNYHRELFKILNNFKEGRKINFPINLFNPTDESKYSRAA